MAYFRGDYSSLDWVLHQSSKDEPCKIIYRLDALPVTQTTQRTKEYLITDNK